MVTNIAPVKRTLRIPVGIALASATGHASHIPLAAGVAGICPGHGIMGRRS